LCNWILRNIFNVSLLNRRLGDEFSVMRWHSERSLRDVFNISVLHRRRLINVHMLYSVGRR